MRNVIGHITNLPSITKLPIVVFICSFKMQANKRKYRSYEIAELIEAGRLVRETNMTVYKASKATGIPWSTLKDFLSRNQDNQQQVAKLGRPYALTPEYETKLFNYIVKMQELGFGLTVEMVRKAAFQLAKESGRENFLKEGNDSASKWWWAQFKKRYNLALRVPENLAAYRASMGNPEMIQDYFVKLEALMDKLNIKNMPNRIWNCDETGLSYVVKPSKIVTSIGKRYIYKRSYADRGESHTLLGCICADGSWIPPLIIFKGIRWNDNLKSNCLPGTLVKLSPKGWINTDLFVEWFQFFINSIPPARPVILLMDSHASHINATVLALAKENDIYLFTFPAHTSHLLQPLDVGVYKSLKANWCKSLNDYMREHPTEKPNRQDFHTLLNPAFIASFSRSNITNAFRKSGACPFDNNAIPREAVTLSILTNKAAPQEPDMADEPEIAAAIDQNEILSLPTAHHPSDVPARVNRRKRDSKAKCLNDYDNVSSLNEPSTSGIKNSKVKTQNQTTSKAKTISEKKVSQQKDNDEEDWRCGVCNGSYLEDCKKKNGARWIQCSYCLVPYHLKCQSSNEDKVFMCDRCTGSSSDDSD